MKTVTEGGRLCCAGMYTIKDNTCVCVCMCVCACICVYIYIYIYVLLTLMNACIKLMHTHTDIAPNFAKAQ